MTSRLPKSRWRTGLERAARACHGYHPGATCGVPARLGAQSGRRPADAAIGVWSQRPAIEDPIGGGQRFLFLVPQEETTPPGTWYGGAGADGTEVALEQVIRMLREEVNRACPDLTRSEGMGRRCARLPLEAGPDGRPGRADRALLTGPGNLGLANLPGAETLEALTGGWLESEMEAVP